MASTSARMLKLLSLLQNHRHWPGGELAGRLEVSERTLRRDIDRLRELGYPVQATRGMAGGYQLRSGTAMPPLLLDDEEAVAVAVGLRTAAGGSVAGIEETSVHALTKLMQVMPPRLRRRVDAIRAYTVPSAPGGPTVDAAALTVIAQACRDHERLRFTYTTTAGAATARLVEPHRLVARQRNWYLVAYDIERGDWRTFRVDRLRAPAATGAAFRPREIPGGEAAAFVQDRLDSRPRHQVVVLVHTPAPEAQQVLRFTGGTADPVDPHSCRLRVSVDNFAWCVLILAAIEAPFEVESPPEFRTYLRTTSQLFLAA